MLARRERDTAPPTAAQAQQSAAARIGRSRRLPGSADAATSTPPGRTPRRRSAGRRTTPRRWRTPRASPPSPTSPAGADPRGPGRGRGPALEFGAAVGWRRGDGPGWACGRRRPGFPATSPGSLSSPQGWPGRCGRRRGS